MAVPTPTHEIAAAAAPGPAPARPESQRLNLSLRIRTSSRSPSGAAPTPTTASSSATAASCASRRRRTSCSAATSEDLIQEGLLGLYKAIRDFRSDRESSFRNFAELCITRQIITAVKTASRNKHAPAQPVRVLRAVAGRRGGLGDDARGGAPGPRQRGSVRARDRDRGAREPGLVPVERALGAGEPTSSPSTSTATPTR